MRRRIDVFVVAPPILCWGLERLAARASGVVRVVGSSGDLDDAERSLQRTAADVLLVDFDAADVERLQRPGMPHPVLLLVPEREERHAERWTSAGVKAVVPRRSSPAQLLAAIRSAGDGGAPALIRVKSDLGAMPGPMRQDLPGFEKLTTRERELALAAVRHATTPGKVLAAELCISEHTLRNHLTSIYGKLGVHSRLSLHALALGHQLDGAPGFLHG